MIWILFSFILLKSRMKIKKWSTYVKKENKKKRLAITARVALLIQNYL